MNYFVLNEKDVKKAENNGKRRHITIKGIIISVAFVVFLIYALITLLNLQVQVTEKTNELDRIEQKIAVQEDKNKEIKNVYGILSKLDESTDSESYNEGLKYIERIAREEYDYINKGERIFVNIAGD